MQPPLSPLFYYLWVAPHCLLAVVLLLMIRRRLYQQFPLFLSYTAFELLQFTVLLALYLHTGSLADVRYRGAFLFGAAISGALRFGIIYEIFVEVFRNYDALRDLSKVLFRCATVILLLIGVALASTHGSGSDGFLLIVPILDRTVRFMQCGLLLFLFLFSRYFGISWRNYAFGIALGFGILASLELVDYAIRSQIVAGSYLLDYLGMATYHCSVLIWIFYLVAKEPQEPSEPPKPRDRIEKKLPEHDLEAWNQDLERLLHQ
jgi:hypothetical protein